MSLFGPDASMCGPMWAAMQVVECETLQTWAGSNGQSHRRRRVLPIGDLLCLFSHAHSQSGETHPPIALSLTLLVQGYVAVRIGILKARTYNDLGVAGVVGAVLISRGAAYAFGVVSCCAH